MDNRIHYRLYYALSLSERGGVSKRIQASNGTSTVDARCDSIRLSFAVRLGDVYESTAPLATADGFLKVVDGLSSTSESPSGEDESFERLSSSIASPKRERLIVGGTPITVPAQKQFLGEFPWHNVEAHAPTEWSFKTQA